jgi:hypothetical protein
LIRHRDGRFIMLRIGVCFAWIDDVLVECPGYFLYISLDRPKSTYV